MNTNTIKWIGWEFVMHIIRAVKAVFYAVYWYAYTCWKSWCVLPMVRVRSYRVAKIANTVLALSVLIAVLITLAVVKAV